MFELWLQQQLFDGLEDDDITSANDTFVPRRSIKKLVIKNKSPSSLASYTQSQVDEELVAPSTNYPRFVFKYQLRFEYFALKDRDIWYS